MKKLTRIKQHISTTYNIGNKKLSQELYAIYKKKGGKSSHNSIISRRWIT